MLSVVLSFAGDVLILVRFWNFAQVESGFLVLFSCVLYELLMNCCDLGNRYVHYRIGKLSTKTIFLIVSSVFWTTTALNKNQHLRKMASPQRTGPRVAI